VERRHCLQVVYDPYYFLPRSQGVWAVSVSAGDLAVSWLPDRWANSGGQLDTLAFEHQISLAVLDLEFYDRFTLGK
jgi:hypothetical protein